MCLNCLEELSFASLTFDPLTRMVMDSDGVTTQELVAVMAAAGAAVAARQAADAARKYPARPDVAHLRTDPSSGEP